MSEAPFAAPGSRGSGGGGGSRIGQVWCAHGYYDPERICNERLSGDHISRPLTAPIVVPAYGPVAEPSPIIGGTVTWPSVASTLNTPYVRGFDDHDHSGDRCLACDLEDYAGPGASDDRNSYFPRALPDPVRDIGGARAVDHRKRVRERRSWLEPAAWLRLPGLTWHKCNQLVRKWRDK